MYKDSEKSHFLNHSLLYIYILIVYPVLLCLWSHLWRLKITWNYSKCYILKWHLFFFLKLYVSNSNLMANLREKNETCNFFFFFFSGPGEMGRGCSRTQGPPLGFSAKARQPLSVSHALSTGEGASTPQTGITASSRLKHVISYHYVMSLFHRFFIKEYISKFIQKEGRVLMFHH